MKEPGRPFQSKLNPYKREIAELRRTSPPTPYVRIAEILNEKYPGLNASHNAVWSFVRVRSKGRKVAYMTLEDEEPKTQQLPAQAIVEDLKTRSKARNKQAQTTKSVDDESQWNIVLPPKRYEK